MLTPRRGPATSGIQSGHQGSSRRENHQVDTRTPEQRSRIMRAVQTANTGPELLIRRLLHGMGYRYRLHVKQLPGRPDLVFPSRRRAILVHGCFWHGHACAKGRLPKSRLEYWGPKIEANKRRDADVLRRLEEGGWQTLVVWQCETRDLQTLGERLCKFLGKPLQTDRLFEFDRVVSSKSRQGRARELHAKTSRNRPLRRSGGDVTRVRASGFRHSRSSRT